MSNGPFSDRPITGGGPLNEITISIPSRGKTTPPNISIVEKVPQTGIEYQRLVITNLKISDLKEGADPNGPHIWKLTAGFSITIE
jgi:hypothetical protein